MRVCGRPGCPTLTTGPYCEAHAPKAWAGSTRREKTISGYKQQKRARRILFKHGYRCHACGLTGATEVDHIIPLAFGGADDETNLAPIHTHCHKQKTAQEAAQARRHA